MPIEILNGFMIDAASQSKALLDSVPQAKCVKVEIRGIVGGDFDVVARRYSNFDHAELATKVEVLAK